MSLLAGPSSGHNHIISAITSWIVCSIANHPYLQINGYSPLVTGINHDFIVTCLHWVFWLLEKTSWAKHVSKCISSTILSIMPIHTYVLLFDACHAFIFIACDGLNRNVLLQCSYSQYLSYTAHSWLLAKLRHSSQPLSPMYQLITVYNLAYTTWLVTFLFYCTVCASIIFESVCWCGYFACH